METKLQLVSNVLTTKRYAFIAITSGTGLGLVYYFLTMSMLPSHLDVTLKLAPYYIITSVGLTVVISALAGINFAMVAFKIKGIKMIKSVKSDSSAVLGGAFAAFTPGCPACTAPLAVILSTVGGLSLFPLQGLELKFISAGILVFSIWWVARGLQNNSCCTIK